MSVERILAINRDRNAVNLNGTRHRIEFLDMETPNPEYTIHPYRFKDALGKEADGCLFKIKPGKSTSVIRIVDQQVKVQEIAIKGKGWFLGISPNGKISKHEVGEGVENPLFELTEGSIGVWIAGKEELEVLDVTTPPFKNEMEEVFEENDTRIPSAFWDHYKMLKVTEGN